MSPKRSHADDRRAFLASLALFDRPERELRERVLEPDDDIDAFLDEAIRDAIRMNVTLPPH